VLTAAPLPRWRDLLRALVCRPATDAELASPWCRTGEIAGWLSRSAWSLALIAQWRQRREPRAPVEVWIPDLFCNSSLKPLRATGVRLTFYPVTDKLAPDMPACRILQKDHSPGIFLLVHYFGQPAAVGGVTEFCGRTGAWLVEDAAHVLRPIHSVGTSGDFVLYSPHKHLPVPEGAVLVVRSSGPAHFASTDMASFGEPNTWVGQLDDLRQKLRCSPFRNRASRLVWLGKRVGQKLGLRSWNRSTIPFREQTTSDPADALPLVPPGHGGLARRLLTLLIGELGAIAHWRQRHQLLWDALLLSDSASPGTTVAGTERPSDREWTPYLAGYCADAGIADSTYIQWQGRGLPVTTWPDLPPEVMADSQEHSNAWSIRHSRIYLPVHQSLSIRELIKKLRDSREGPVPAPRLEFAWDKAARTQWDEMLTEAGRSNLLQSWAYGLAKASTSAWRVRRCVIHCSGEPVALVQVLHRRIAGILSVSRINRGPLFLQGSPPGRQSDVWKGLAHLGDLRRGRVFTVAPEAELTGSALLSFANCGFRQFSPLAWESAWVDLGLELVTLRKRLDGKWRNMLSASEKTALHLDIATDDRSFEWLMEKYRENMQHKNFQGPAIGLLRSMRYHLESESKPIVMRALVGDEAVAGICLVTHGAAATYLLGWNGEGGRTLKANQYLLWQAIVHLKERGLRWLDLGGLDEERLGGITAFKLGINGERYETVGEFWKW
jgi:hypothetical protein